MKAIKRTLTLLLALTGLVQNAAFSKAEGSQLAGTAAMMLLSGYNDTLRQFPTDPVEGGDIRIACVSHVFKIWTGSYLTVLRKGPLKANEAPAKLTEVAETWYQIPYDFKSMEFYRPGISDEVISVYEKMLEEEGAPSSVDKLAFTFDDIKHKDYAAHLEFCKSTKLLVEILPRLKDFAATGALPGITGPQTAKSVLGRSFRRRN